MEGIAESWEGLKADVDGVTWRGMKEINDQGGWFIAMCVSLRLRAGQSLEEMSLLWVCGTESITAIGSRYL